jgi:hypothetical protein
MTDMILYSFQAFATNNAWKKIHEHGATIRQVRHLYPNQIRTTSHRYREEFLHCVIWESDNGILQFVSQQNVYGFLTKKCQQHSKVRHRQYYSPTMDIITKQLYPPSIVTTILDGLFCSAQRRSTPRVVRIPAT